MFRLLKWLFVLVVLTVVVCAACHEMCCDIIPLSVLEGLLAGFGQGLVTAYCLMERVSNSDLITARRLIKFVKRDARVGMVSGLLIGVTYAFIMLLS